VAALAPAIVAVLPGRIPQVVVLIFGGILIGPQGLGIGRPGSITLLSDIGLGFLFLMAGYELEPGQLRQRSGRLAPAHRAAHPGRAFRPGRRPRRRAGRSRAPAVDKRMGVDVEPLENKLEAVGYGVFCFIALAAIGLSDGVMLPSNAAALVGAGVVSVLVFPAVATLLRRRGQPELKAGRR
jgi:Kef-type K+ transport system membrane component KefB